MSSICLILMSILGVSFSQFLTNSIPNITDVSAMCSSEGITAAIDFSEKFSGKIYSLDYATVHDCVYFNSMDTRTILFSIPAHRCGTKLSRTSRNIIDQMENRVYVQMDKDMQSAADKQFNFICQLSDGRISKTVRRHPMRDSYVTFTSDAKSMGEPIKPKEVRIAASSDITFGNWPIPGSKPYNPSMKPAAVFPKLPVATVVNYPIPSTTPSNQLTPAQQYLLSEPIRANVLDHYASLSPYSQKMSLANPIQATIRRAPMNTLLAKVNPESYIQPPINNYVATSLAKNPPILPLRSPTLEVTTIRNNYVESPQVPINPDIHMKQGIGMGAVMGHRSATPVPARTWNLGQVTMPADAYGTTPLSTSNKKYIEEPKRVGLEFTNDVNENSVTVNEESTPQVHLISTQENFAPNANVQLEIQEGNGPFGSAVSKPVKIGENITLVVKALSQAKENGVYDMFVHSCFATDGPGTTKIDLIDRDGCVIRKEFVSPLQRIKNKSQILYYFHISAFKFPGPDDVYFSCSIELTPLRSAPEICTTQRRTKREAKHDIRLFDIVKVELAEKYENDKLIAEESQMYCGSQAFVILMCSIILCVFLAFTISTTIAITLNAKLRSIQLKL